MSSLNRKSYNSKPRIHTVIAAIALVVWGVSLDAFASPAVPNSPVSAVLSQAPGVLTFQAWKSLRTDEARLILERLTLESQMFAASTADRMPGERQAVVRAVPTSIEAAPPSVRSSPRAALRARPDSRVEQARLNLEIAQDLTINDYLQIYLSQFKNPEVLRDVARRMNPDEVADLLMAYQKAATVGDLAESNIGSGSRLCASPTR